MGHFMEMLMKLLNLKITEKMIVMQELNHPDTRLTTLCGAVHGSPDGIDTTIPSKTTGANFRAIKLDTFCHVVDKFASWLFCNNSS